jgi:hypothetical protein
MQRKTFKEVLSIVNPRGERHPDTAYQVPISSFNSKLWSDTYPEESIKKIKQFNRKGIDFDLYELTIDRWALEYSARDEFGETIEDSNGRPVRMTEEEKRQKIKPRYEYEHLVVEREIGQRVGYSSDEWGCLLIMVAEEYQSMGLGQEILKMQMERHPERHTGGFTPSGKEAYFKCYQHFVAKHMAAGGYSQDVREGRLSADKAMEIIDSAMITKESVLKSRAEYIREGCSEKTAAEINPFYKRISKIDRATDYDFNKGRILVSSDSNYVILFNEKALDLYKPSAQDNYFRDRAIMGYAYVGGVYDTSKTPKLYGLFAKNKEYLNLSVELAMNLMLKDPVLLTKEQMDVVSSNERLKDFIDIQTEGTKFTQVVLSKPTIPNLPQLLYTNNALIKIRDPFDESLNSIHEVTVQISESLANDLSNEKMSHLSL